MCHSHEIHRPCGTCFRTSTLSIPNYNLLVFRQKVRTLPRPRTVVSRPRTPLPPNPVSLTNNRPTCTWQSCKDETTRPHSERDETVNPSTGGCDLPQSPCTIRVTVVGGTVTSLSSRDSRVGRLSLNTTRPTSPVSLLLGVF